MMGGTLNAANVQKLLILKSIWLSMTKHTIKILSLRFNVLLAFWMNLVAGFQIGALKIGILGPKAQNTKFTTLDVVYMER